jgi:DNA mismatch repair protein MutL
MSSHLEPIEFEDDGIRISGYASLPSFSKRNAESIFFYVNQRFIKDRMIYKAVLDAYRHILPNNQFPVVILFIALPPSAVDVNVHPTKAEVKFQNPDRVYQAVLASVKMVLQEGPSRSKEMVLAREVREKGVHRSTPPTFFRQEDPSAPSFFMSGKGEGVLMIQDEEGLPWKPEDKWAYTILGQIQGTYILCEGEGNLIFIDQHAAHERILFEKFKKKYENRLMASERLLLPVLMECSAEESYIVESNGEALKEVGFEIERVGGKLFAIRSMPCFIDPKDSKEFVRKILDELSFLEKGKKGEEAIQTLLVALACHSAVRANSLLRREEIERLVKNLISFHRSTTCPHGRPIFFVLPLEELGKKFKRK